jgi:hypothetical protein
VLRAGSLPLLAALLLGACSACGGGGGSGEAETSDPADPPTPAPQVLTLGDHGRTFTLARGRSTSLRLPTASRSWTKPEASGGALTIYVVNYVQDPGGFAEWTLEATAPGRAVVTSVGSCDGCEPAERTFRVTIVVPA